MLPIDFSGNNGLALKGFNFKIFLKIILPSHLKIVPMFNDLVVKVYVIICFDLKNTGPNPDLTL